MRQTGPAGHQPSISKSQGQINGRILGGKSLKLRFHPNNTRNEAMVCFSTEEEAQLALTEIITYKGWRAELYTPIRKSREFERETEKPDNSNKEHEQTKNNKSSTKQVEFSHLKEEIKYIKRTLDILLERQ